jgi:hypothetical protein
MKRLVGALVVIALVAVAGLWYLKGNARIGQTAQGSFFYGFYDVGLRLSGREVTTPMTDFSWTDTIRWVQIETTPWYRIPYHITTDFARDINDNALYTHSSYRGPGTTAGSRDIRDDFGSARAWNRNLIRDPRMRFKMWGDDRVFRATARLVTDPVEYEKARQAFHTKVLGQGTGLCPPEGTDPPPCGQEKQKPEDRSRTYFFRIIPEFSGN